MRFASTDDQLALRDAVRDLLAKECPPEVVRAAWPDGTDAHGARKGEGARADADRVARVWSALADMGVLGVAVPEEHGGLGMAELDWVLVAEETGYAALPHPFVETAAVAAPLLAAVGDPDGPARRRCSTGPARPASSRWAPGWCRGATPSACCSASTSTPPPARGPPAGSPAAWPRATTGPWPTSSTPAVAPSCSRRGGPATALGTAADAALAFDRGALGTAAQLVGLARRMIDLTVGYVGERKQFGVPIGSFQAVKHHLADAALRLRVRRPRPSTGGLVAGHGRADGAPRRVDGQGPGVRRRPPRRPHRPPVPRRHRLHDRVRPAPLPEAGRGPGPHVGRRRLAPRPGGRRPRPSEPRPALSPRGHGGGADGGTGGGRGAIHGCSGGRVAGCRSCQTVAQPGPTSRRCPRGRRRRSRPRPARRCR